MSETTKQRTIRLSLRLSEDMNNRLGIISNDLGVPLSTLCAFAVGEYVDKREKQQAYFIDQPS